MSSQVDVTKPVYGSPTTQSVRDNFSILSNEITALQNAVAPGPFLPLTGGTINGPLYLHNDPTDPRMPATKAYVDAGGGSGGGGVPDAPADGTLYARRDGGWDPAVDTTEMNSAIASAIGMVTEEAPQDSGYYGRWNKSWKPVLSTLGGTLTGFLILSNDPTLPLHAATKQYVDTKAGAYLPLTGGTLTGDLISSGLAATTQAIYFKTGVIARWGIFSTAEPESGNNIGSNLWIDRFSDTGTDLGTVISINRNNGLTRILGRTLINSAADDTTSGLMVNGPVSFSNTLATGGNITTQGNITGKKGFFVDHIFVSGPNATNRGLALTNTTYNSRWELITDAADETGSNNGSNFGIARYGDNNAFIGWSLLINRADSFTSIAGRTVINSAQTNDTQASLLVGGNVKAGAFISNGGNFYVDGAPAFYFYWGRDTGNGNWRVVENGVQTCWFDIKGGFHGCGDNIKFYESGAYRFLQFQAGYNFQWSIADGTLSWLNAAGVQWQCRTSDNLAYNPLGTVGGNGAYLNVSDIRTKTNVTATERGLNEILQLTPIEFERIPTRQDGVEEVVRREIGFDARQVQKFIPEATVAIGLELPDGSGKLDSDDPTLAMTYDTIVTVSVSAIKELHKLILSLKNRVDQLERTA